MDNLYTFADGDNHPDVVSTTYGDDWRWITPFLIVSWIVTALILMSYATALMFDKYIQAQQDLVMERQVQKQLNLFATFVGILVVLKL